MTFYPDFKEPIHKLIKSAVASLGRDGIAAHNQEVTFLY